MHLWVIFLNPVLSRDIQFCFATFFPRQGFGYKLRCDTPNSSVEIIQNKPSWKLQQTMPQRNVEQTTLQLVTTRYSLSVELGWPSLIQRVFAAALEAAPCGTRHDLVQWRGPRDSITRSYSCQDLHIWLDCSAGVVYLSPLSCLVSILAKLAVVWTIEQGRIRLRWEDPLQGRWAFIARDVNACLILTKWRLSGKTVTKLPGRHLKALPFLPPMGDRHRHTITVNEQNILSVHVSEHRNSMWYISFFLCFLTVIELSIDSHRSSNLIFLRSCFLRCLYYVHRHKWVWGWGWHPWQWLPVSKIRLGWM